MDQIKFFSFENVKPVLVEIAKFFEKAGIPYGFFAGTAAYFYGSTRDLDDIDVLTTKEGVEAFGKKFSSETKNKESAMFGSYGTKSIINGVDVEVTASLSIKKDGEKYLFDFDEKMTKNLKKIKMDGQELCLISAEDIVAFKSITQREGNGKFDLTDIKNILDSTKIDQKSVQERLKMCGFSGNR